MPDTAQSVPIPAGELADRLGIGPDRVARLAAAGAIEPDAEGRFDPGDVHRVRLLLAFESAGVPLEALLDASRSGAISLRYYDELHAPPGPLSDRTFETFVASLGPGREHLVGMFAAFGIAEPEPSSRLTVADEAFITEILAVIDGIAYPDLAMRALRLFGEAARRSADGSLGVYRESVQRGGDQLLGLPTDELYAAVLRPWAHFARQAAPLAAWLAGRHMTRAIDEYSVIETERILEASGFVAPRLDLPPAIAFVDLTGFTRMTEEQGDEVAADIAIRLGSVTIGTVGARGGRIVKLLGDGVLVRFDDAPAAADGALDLLAALPDAGLPSAHAGVAAGPLIVRDGDVFGRTVNLAARIADATPDGRLYMPEAVASGLDPSRFSIEPVAAPDLQGIGEVALADVGRVAVSP
jgi:adenylate cyclase